MITPREGLNTHARQCPPAMRDDCSAAQGRPPRRMLLRNGLADMHNRQLWHNTRRTTSGVQPTKSTKLCIKHKLTRSNRKPLRNQTSSCDPTDGPIERRLSRMGRWKPTRPTGNPPATATAASAALNDLGCSSSPECPKRATCRRVCFDLARLNNRPGRRRRKL